MIDPDNLPPEAIQRAARALYVYRYNATGWDTDKVMHDGLVAQAEAAITAFLSDPEPGDQT